MSSITTDTTTYTFSYDGFGNSTGVTAGNHTLATYEYYPNNGKLKKINYGNGFSEEYSYNSLELLDKIWYNYNDGTRELAYSYTYNNDGTLKVFTNHLDGTSIEYEYDVHGRFVSASETNSSDLNYKNEYKVNNYDADGRVTRTTGTINYLSNSAYTPLSVGYLYTYNNDGTLKEERILSSAVPTTIVDYYYDSFNRTTKVDRRIDGFRYTTEYGYYFDSNKTNGFVSEVINTINGSSTTYNYTYDSNGNITKIVNGSNETTYTYDDLGQLVSEQSGRVTKNYTYDNAGNITSVKTVTESSSGDHTLFARLPPLNPPGSTVTTVNLTYSDSQWGDLLTSYDGTTITYDEIGNPLSYYNGSAYTFTWEGRQLVGAVKGSNILTFVYNDEDIRTSKTVNGVTHTYYSYTDAWGNHNDYTTVNASEGAQYNPFRYRGYYYDTDLGMYYLQSRYYDAKICRFINADGYVSTGQGLTGYNMFAYCSNNPIMHIDPSGESWVALGIVGAVVNVAITFFAAKITQQDYTIVDVGVAAASGFANAIPVVGPLVGGIISGTYAGYATYKNGASVGGAILAGTVTGIATTASIGNLSGALGIPLDLPLAAITDLVFGTGYNLIAAAVSKAVTSTERNTESSNGVLNFFEDVFGSMFA